MGGGIGVEIVVYEDQVEFVMFGGVFDFLNGFEVLEVVDCVWIVLVCDMVVCVEDEQVEMYLLFYDVMFRIGVFV